MRFTTTTTRPTRRLVTTAAAATLLLALGACGSGSGSDEGTGATSGGAETTDLTVGATTSISGLSLQAGIAEGYFKDRGLNVTFTPNKSANETIPQLLNGGLDIAQMDTLTLMQAVGKGIPVKIIAGAGLQSTDGADGEMSAASVVTGASSTIEGPADLVGKKVGVPALKTQTWMNIRDIVDEAGGDSSQIQFVEVPPAQTIDLVTRGEVDASTPPEPLASAAIASGAVKLVHNTDAPGNKGVASSVYVATEQFVAENPDTVRDFAEGLQAAAKDVNDSRELAVKVAVDQLDYKPEQLENAFIQTFATEPVTAEGLDKLADLAVKYEILTEKPDTKAMLADVA